MSEKTFYYEYVPGLIGMKTNIKGFRWGFGMLEKSVSDDVYEQCKIKVELDVKNNSRVFENENIDEFKREFRHFRASGEKYKVIYDQCLARIIKLRYVISINENKIKVSVGKSYLRFVKTKLMNIHPMAYILFDAVSMLLLKNKMTTLYCSAVSEGDDATVFMAPPNTGKSLTALKIIKDKASGIIAEDMAVTDGINIWGAPFTNLYRDYHDESLKEAAERDSINTVKRIKNVVFLRKGNDFQNKEIADYSEQLFLINHYSLGYTYSPCVRALNFFNGDFSLLQAENTEKEILETMSKNARGFVTEKTNPLDFADSVKSLISGKGE